MSNRMREEFAREYDNRQRDAGIQLGIRAEQGVGFRAGWDAARQLYASVPVSVYPFHSGTPQLFHVSCDECPDFGFCGMREEAEPAADQHRASHMQEATR